ncbi:hypothetical protein EVAR_48224_1 [Eumeta japonica]|uniref:Uncharacterized protein n=1 Tax=Eumeta variegata TaxID=151549 RepID=A0A4C1YIM0_EUMVA|nr:hypothetical protein EVAR_48224_1 [Eumeta japonica]
MKKHYLPQIQRINVSRYSHEILPTQEQFRGHGLVAREALAYVLLLVLAAGRKSIIGRLRNAPSAARGVTAVDKMADGSAPGAAPRLIVSKTYYGRNERNLYSEICRILEETLKSLFATYGANYSKYLAIWKASRERNNGERLRNDRPQISAKADHEPSPWRRKLWRSGSAAGCISARAAADRFECRTVRNELALRVGITLKWPPAVRRGILMRARRPTPAARRPAAIRSHSCSFFYPCHRLYLRMI